MTACTAISSQNWEQSIKTSFCGLVFLFRVKKKLEFNMSRIYSGIASYWKKPEKGNESETEVWYREVSKLH